MIVKEKTGYEWSLDANVRVLNVENWNPLANDGGDSYYTEKITPTEFYTRLGLCLVKANSTPRKSEKFLEYRMYGLVPYNISPIQQGIQYGHAVVEYGNKFKDSPIYQKWATEDKTFIILNGGTTNLNEDRLGSLNKAYDELVTNGIEAVPFYEPDLGDQLTGIVLLVDERVFNKELYPDFVGSPYTWPSHKKPSEKEFSKWEAENNKNYASWLEKIGGANNAFLRDFLKTKRLA